MRGKSPPLREQYLSTAVWPTTWPQSSIAHEYPHRRLEIDLGQTTIAKSEPDHANGNASLISTKFCYAGLVAKKTAPSCCCSPEKEVLDIRGSDLALHTASTSYDARSIAPERCIGSIEMTSFLPRSATKIPSKPSRQPPQIRTRWPLLQKGPRDR